MNVRERTPAAQLEAVSWLNRLWNVVRVTKIQGDDVMGDDNNDYKFRLSEDTAASYPDAEAVFRDLRNRDPVIQHLWSHQADIIREYHQHVDEKHIALELPTGTGKTLVGLLIGEWRRRTNGERVAYLCPTRQLAHQVGDQSRQYGIPSYVLVGPQDKYPPDHYAAFASAEAICITTYSGVFNTSPKIDNAEFIILDDTHAGEGYIASMWSLEISRFSHSDLYNQVIQLFEKQLPPSILPDLFDEEANPNQRSNVDLLPLPRAWTNADAFASLVNEYANRENKLIFPWQLLRSHLSACIMLFSWSEIVVRPAIPPALTHLPFADANQRLFMSATLGAGGELERITGVPSIHRIPVPPGWDKQSTGRRLFIFPDRSFQAEEYQPWIGHHVHSMDRVLCLTPHKFAADEFTSILHSAGVEHEVLKSHDVEVSLEPFTTNPQAILLLTNRYDGLDLPGDSCRSLVVYGLPTSVNLYERFLWSKLGLSGLLSDRIRTRITQAVGRCTRSSTDYAVVLMIGSDLFDYCIARENRADLHPELRAEIEFGIDNSEASDIEDLSTLIDLFMARDERWGKAELDIAKRRSEVAKLTSSYIESLRSTVGLEVQYQYDLWQEDFAASLEKATTIVDLLGGDDLAGYRALWYYFAGCSAFLFGTITSSDELMRTAADRFYRASQASKAIPWFVRLSHELSPQSEEEYKSTIMPAIAAESIVRYLLEIGTVGPSFEKTIASSRDDIQQIEHEKFEPALAELGKMLGFDAHKPSGQGTPDSVWILGTEYVVLFEAKSEESPTGEISIRTCRQAQGHEAWQRSRPFFSQNAAMITVVISPRESLDKEAIPHAEGLLYMHPQQIQELFARAEACLRKIRSAFPGLQIEQRYQLALDKFMEDGITPEDIISLFHKNPLIKILSNE